MRTIRDIIKDLGGNSAVARIIGKGPSTVSEMARRGTIAVEYWPVLVAAAPDASLAERDRREPFVLTNDMLVDAHTQEMARAVA